MRFNEDWLCPNCNFYIYTYKVICKKCGITKADALLLLSSINNSMSVKEEVKEDVKEDVKEKWCKVCESKFNAIDNKCETCGSKLIN
jgi:hypothetical protein